jgi:cation diffusion facilitator family transporter
MSAASKTAQRAAVASILVAVVFSTVKIIIGLRANSVAVVSDGFESAADSITSFMVWVGLWVAAKPADDDHPYGHGRFETLMGLGVGLFLVAAGAGICVRALELRYDPHIPPLFALWPVLGSMAVKSALAGWKLQVGKRTGSAGLTADAKHDLVDLLSGGVAVLAVLLANFAPGGMSAADHYGGVLIGALVIFMGVRVVRETVLQLMDTMPDPEQMTQIRSAALRVPGAIAVEKCFARKTGLRYHVDLHLEVDPLLTVYDSHEIATSVKHSIKQELVWVEDVLIHVEPHLKRWAPKTLHGKP